MKIGIIVALDREYAQLHRLLGGRDEGEVAGNAIVLRRSGIGKVNAALKAAELIDGQHPDCIVSTGVAGGLAPGLKSMDVVAARQIAYHDVWCGEGNEYGQIQGLPARFDCNATLLAAASSQGPGVRCGLICSGDFFIGTREEGEAILSRFPDALAVDMESGALAHTCHLRGIPFLSLRIISDAAGDGHQAEYDNFWETVADNSFNVIHDFLLALPESL